MTNNKEFWNQVTRSGLILGAVSIAYMLIGLFLNYKGDAKIITAFLPFFRFAFWGFKIWFCIWLLKKFIVKYYNSNPDLQAINLVNFGRMTALFSALLFAAATMALLVFVKPDLMKEVIDAAVSTGMYNKAQLELLNNVAPQLPTYAFFSVLIYCYLFGAIATKIIVSKIHSRNPFNNAN